MAWAGSLVCTVAFMILRAARRAIGLAGVALVVPVAAGAAAPLGLVDCAPTQGVHACSGLVPTWDGVPLDVTVVLPSARPGRPLPLVAEISGLGNSKWEYLDPASKAYTDNAFAWAKAGYAVLTYTPRGFWGSCGTPESRAANPGPCARGYLHLADTRYEVRDAQHLIGSLVDDGVADPRRIGVTGDSYGGGQSLALAALNDRTMLPDGSLVPWVSPRGRTPLRLAAAAPVIPWTDLVGAIAPNGRTRSVGVTPGLDVAEPVGVFKTSVANAIFAATTTAIGPGQPLGEPSVPGRPMGYLAPPGVDPSADVASWVARADAGEPYREPFVQEVIGHLRAFRSAYGIDASTAPPPLYLGSGFTDDIFPVDEVLRYANRLHRDHPRVPTSLLLGDFGHQRAANKQADRDRLVAGIRGWLDFHVRGVGAAPAEGVVALSQTCPRARPSEGPFTASSFAALADGTTTLRAPAAGEVVSGSGDPETGRKVDPAAGGGDGCARVTADDAPGTVVLRAPAAGPGGTLLLGAPRLRASLRIDGEPTSSQLAARLWDVDPRDGTQRLVTRGLLRPGGQGDATFELRPNAYRFAAGHVAKLELSGADAPYGRPSNAAFRIAVRDLELVLPTRSAAAGARTCASRRRFAVRLPRDLRGARATLDGRRVPIRRGKVVVDLRGRAKGTAILRITGRARRGGARVVQTRRYRTCVPRRG